MTKDKGSWAPREEETTLGGGSDPGQRDPHRAVADMPSGEEEAAAGDRGAWQNFPKVSVEPEC